MALVGEVRATKKPDAYNVLKRLKDGCKGIVWKAAAGPAWLALHIFPVQLLHQPALPKSFSTQ